MIKSPRGLRGRLFLFTAITSAGLGFTAAAYAQSASTETVVIPGEAAPTDLNAYQIQQVKIRYKKLLLKEKDIPNAVTVIGPKAIQAENPVMGSIQTLLNKTPSVTAYAQGPGQSAPTLAIRGIRNDELAETLNDVPINDLLAGSGDYLSNNIGSAVTLNEIDGATVYPGVAPPDHQGFNTVGGTIAYTTKQPTDERYEELEGGFGSFNTQHLGFVINTGKMSDDIDAPKALMLYDQSQTSGYVDNTNAQYHDFMLNAVKPYDQGLSKVGLVIIFNQGKGNVQTGPTPVPLIQQYGYTYNFPKDQGFSNDTGKFLTTILSDETYINEHMIFNGSLFYLHSSGTTDSYSNPATVTGETPYIPNIQTPFPFYGALGPTAAANGVSSGRYEPGYFTYDPLIFNPNGDPTDQNSYAAGESSQYSTTHNNTVGITPKLTIFAGDHNTITIGGLLAKESGFGGTTQSVIYTYGGAGAKNNQINGYNSIGLGGGQQRTVYVAYVQDKIDLFNNHLHILPGARVNAAYSSNIQQFSNVSYNPAKLQNFTKVGEPYIGVSYDLPYHVTAYGSYGKGSLFSPVTDYSVGITPTGLPGGTTAPTPEIVHLYEAGVRYDTPRLYLNADYFYQKVSDAFSFYTNYLLNAQYYANTGAYLARGVEMSGEFRVTPEISIFANASYNNTDYLNNYFAFVTLQQDQFGYARKGTPISNVPIWNSFMGIDYDNGPYSARLSGQYTGREYTTYDLVAYPLDSNPLNGATTTNTDILNPANYVVNLLLSYKVPVHYGALKDLTLALNMQNILDEHYYVYTFNQVLPVGGIYNAPGSSPFNAALIGPPRSITLDLTAKF